jgi:hypothetical protein
MTDVRKLATILVVDVAGYSRLAGADEDRILARLRALRSDLIDPTIAVHDGRIVKRTGDGSMIEFGSVVDAARYAIEMQSAMVERNAGLPREKRIEGRWQVHLTALLHFMSESLELGAPKKEDGNGTDRHRRSARAACLSPDLSFDPVGGRRRIAGPH